jgi:hypothetical protein
MAGMTVQSRWKALLQIAAVRVAIFAIGVALMIAAPLVAPLPGPAGTVLFALGLGLVLQTSHWARRRYVKFKRRYPRPGNITDWGLRRQSYKRRQKLKKQTSGD